jgi:hypothetical protein
MPIHTDEFNPYLARCLEDYLESYLVIFLEEFQRIGNGLGCVFAKSPGILPGNMPGVLPGCLPGKIGTGEILAINQPFLLTPHLSPSLAHPLTSS